LIFDTESVPDGVLIGRTKYPCDKLAPEEAIARAQAEARESSSIGSDFLNVSLQIPVAVCVANVAGDFRLLKLTCLDEPQFRPQEITRGFWRGLERYCNSKDRNRRAKIVTFNGRAFDFPLMEVAAFRYGVAAPFHFKGDRDGPRSRFGDSHIDLCDYLNNLGACRLAGGLNLFAKLLGKPGKTETSGDQVYGLYRQGGLQAINEYCCFDVLDTYFVFLRTRVLTGELTLEQEHAVVQDAKSWISQHAKERPHLQRYLDNWGDWQPWV
jgi:predicted PolB exonuclease-like 3'-5' exonuclease